MESIRENGHRIKRLRISLSFYFLYSYTSFKIQYNNVYSGIF